MSLPKVLVLDVDGVLTDGTKYYERGKPIGKIFNDRDFTAIKLFKSRRVNVVFLSADDSNSAVASDRNIDWFNSRDKMNRIIKEQRLPDIAYEYGALVSDIWYIGDDVFDLPIILEINRLGGKTFCPIDAPHSVQSRVSEIIPLLGGHGIVMWLFERYACVTLEDIKAITEIDKNEQWSHRSRESA